MVHLQRGYNMKKVLNISVDDYANFAHDNANALRSVGVKCIDVKLHKHVFNYARESEVVNEKTLKALIDNSNLIQIFHSDSSLLKYCKRRRTVVYHTGTRYRQRPEIFNAQFNPHVERSFIALGEFAGKGSKNETYIVGATPMIGTRSLHFIKPLCVAHYPSSPEVKGSEGIISVLDKVQDQFGFKVSCSTNLVPHKEQIARMNSCDVYIEMNSLMQGGKPYGSWGITALEAAALSKIVVTNHTTVKVYERTYGIRPPFILIEEYGTLERALEYLAGLSDVSINNMKINSYDWVKKYHSFEATGNRLKQILSL